MSGICRNAGYWSNADQFDPDRFPVDGPIPNEVTEVYNYLPFGGGRRKCIGEPAKHQKHTHCSLFRTAELSQKSAT